MIIPRIQTGDRILNQIQQNIASAVEPAINDLGAYLELLQKTATNVATTAVYQDFAGGPLFLSSGDWDVTISTYWLDNGSTCTSALAGISLYAGPLFSDAAPGSNYSRVVGPTGGIPVMAVLPSFRINLSSTTPVYGKIFANFSAGHPQYQGRLSARKILS